MKRHNLLIFMSILFVFPAHAAWHDGRDNSMKDADDQASQSMMILSNKNGKSIAFQICPGVFLTSAHGLLNTPERAKINERPINDIKNQRIRLYAFPMTPQKALTDRELNFSYISPMLQDKQNWAIRHLDYAFVIADPETAVKTALKKGFSYNPDNFISPLIYAPKSFENANLEGKVSTHLYRGRPRLPISADSFPIRNSSGQFDGTKYFSNRDSFSALDKPQRVVHSCTIRAGKYMFRNDCPTEQGVSGSPYVSKIGDSFYTVGLHVSGTDYVASDTPKLSHKTRELGAAGIMPNQFCEDYKKVCGMPCAKYEKIIK